MFVIVIFLSADFFKKKNERFGYILWSRMYGTNAHDFWYSRSSINVKNSQRTENMKWLSAEHPLFEYVPSNPFESRSDKERLQRLPVTTNDRSGETVFGPRQTTKQMLYSHLYVQIPR
jgi:hypothetical protein